MTDEQFSTGGVSWIVDWPLTEQQVIDVVKAQEARIADLEAQVAAMRAALEAWVIVDTIDGASDIGIWCIACGVELSDDERYLQGKTLVHKPTCPVVITEQLLK